MKMSQINRKTLPPTQQQMTRFGSKAYIDLGASKSLGNFRLALVDQEDKPFPTQLPQTTVTKVPVNNTSEFMEGFAQHIINTLKQNNVGKEDPLDTIVSFVPGPVLKNRVSILANIKNQAEEPLRNLDFNKLPDLIRKVLPKSTSPKVQVITANDMLGGTAHIAKELVNHGNKYSFQPGTTAFLIMTGGGVGNMEISYPNKKELHLISAEFGHIPTHTGSNIDLESGSVSAPALIRNFATALSLSKEKTSELLQAGNARIVTSFEEAEKVIPSLDSSAHQQGAKKAIDEYIGGAGQLFQILAMGGVNTIVLTGPLVDGINQYIEKHSKDFPVNPKLPTSLKKPHSKISQLILSHIWKTTHDFGRNRLLDLQFKIVTDLKLPNNLEGASIVAQGTQRNNEILGKNPFAIPIKGLQKSSETTKRP